MHNQDVVITGVGVVSPIGIGREAVWESFRNGQSGVGPIRSFDAGELPVQIAAEVHDFDPRQFIKPRKNLKVMCRDAQFGVAASRLAREDAQLGAEVDSERLGVVLGADPVCGSIEDSVAPYRSCIAEHHFDEKRWGTDGLATLFPLSFLKMLPNMIASHVSIAHDARGPCNTIHQGDVSGLLAVVEATRVIQRGQADVMLAGGASSQMNPFDWVRHCLIGRLSRTVENPASVVRPFDANRDGQVRGEAAAVFVLESAHHAEARGARIYARMLGAGSTHNGRALRREPSQAAIGRAMARGLEEADLTPNRVGHVNAHGLSTASDDRTEALAIRDMLDGVPVTALKSYFGNTGAAGGALELVGSLLALTDNLIPVTLNYGRFDPSCPIRVVHDEPVRTDVRTALAVNWTWAGQATAVVLGGAA